MSYDDIVTRRGEGALVAAWSIDGIQFLFTSKRDVPFSTTGLPAGLTQIRGCLQTEGLKWGAGADPKQGDLKIPDNTFRLVDVEDANGTQHKITDILRGVTGVARTELLLTVTATEVGAIDVFDTTDFPASGDVWIDQECIGYASKTGTTFLTLTRGKYGSKAVEHVSDADLVNGEIEGGSLIPDVTSAPVDWNGRYVTLWIAELHYGNAAGTFETGAPEAVWRGRILDNYGLAPDNMTWEFPTEGLWDVIDATLPITQSMTALKGWNFQGPYDFTWYLANEDGFLDQGDTTLSPLPPYAFGRDLFNALTATVNDALEAAGHVDQIEIFPDSDTGRISLRKVRPTPANDRVVQLRFHGGLRHIFGFSTNVIEGGFQGVIIEADGGPEVVGREGIGYASAFFMTNDYREPFDLPVKSTAGFEDFYEVGPGSDVHATVRVGEAMFLLVSIPDSTTLRLVGLAEGTEVLDRNVAGFFGATFMAATIGDIPVVQGIMLEGDYVECWKRFLESGASAALKGYLDTDDFDWDELRANRGVQTFRTRVILEPASFRDLLRQDLAWSGAYPTISGASSRLLSARVLGATNSADVKLFIDASVIATGRKVVYQEGRGRVINRLVYRGGYVWSDQKFTNDDPLTINSRKHQQGRQISPKTREIKNSGIKDWKTRDYSDEGIDGVSRAAVELASTAAVYFELFAKNNPIVKVPCTIAAAHLVPGDTVRLSHWLLPDKAFGVRGVTNEVMMVLENIIHPFDDGPQCNLTLLWLTDGVKRSGYAPCADVVDYTTPSGAETLTLDSGVYATAQAEGIYFNAGEKIVLQQIDKVGAGVADETFTIVSVSADGLTVVIDGAPTAGMQAEITDGNVWMVHDSYQENAGNAAQGWLYVCDDADHLIGTTNDTGYQPS